MFAAIRLAFRNGYVFALTASRRLGAQGNLAANDLTPEAAARARAAPTPAGRHLVIAGTGRAGTSFLVRYLTALGLDTHLSRQGVAADWDDNAQAGLEDMLAGDNAPYVIKSPWIGEYIEEFLRKRSFEIDAFVVPIRDLVEAASSRAVLEQRAIHQSQPWMAEKFDRSWEVFGHTAGGTVYSLNPLDQARLLAVQFHQLVLRVSQAGIPLIFPVFPRMATDWEYLYTCVKPVLPAGVTQDVARRAHARVANTSLVRVADELAERKGNVFPLCAEPQFGPRYPSCAEIDNIALRREIVRLREECALQAGKSVPAATTLRARAVRKLCRALGL